MMNDKLLYKKSYIILFVVYSLSFIAANAQTREIDSLIKVLKTEKEDTNKIKTLTDLSYPLSGIKTDSSILLAQQALTLSKKLAWKKGEAFSYNDLGIGYEIKSDYPKALDYNLEALKTFEEIGDKEDQTSALLDIGNIYSDLDNNNEALNYYLKSLKLAEETRNKKMQLGSLGNLGAIYKKLGDYSKALNYDLKCLNLCKETKNKKGQAIIMCNIGVLYKKQGDYARALDYYQKAIQIDKEVGYKRGQAINLDDMGGLYTIMGKFKEAESSFKEAILLDSTIGQQENLKEAEEDISFLYDTTQRYKLSLYWFKKATALKDTIFNIEKNKALTRKELTYQFDKKQTEEKAEQDKKDVLAAADKKKQQIITGFISGGLILVLASLGLLFSRFKVTQKQKRIIERQKALVEEKNKDIIDSITYAKRLQSAILPPISLVKQYFPESFILYKPKDIVAGDFYWMQKVSKLDGKGDIILIAAADCTGHGVPGAMVSVVCSNAINRIVKETEVRDTGSVLDNVRDVVLETFSTSEGEVKDGMDISFCAINRQANILEWTGANNPLWYIHKNKLIEIAPDKQPVGIQDNPKPFTTHLVNIEKGDIIYLFTDGYADQFGGPKGKKFKYKQLQEKLLAIAHLTMEEQKAELENTLETWKGSLEQVDDILVMGIKV